VCCVQRKYYLLSVYRFAFCVATTLLCAFLRFILYSLSRSFFSCPTALELKVKKHSFRPFSYGVTILHKVTRMYKHNGTLTALKKNLEAVTYNNSTAIIIINTTRAARRWVTKIPRDSITITTSFTTLFTFCFTYCVSKKSVHSYGKCKTFNKKTKKGIAHLTAYDKKNLLAY